LTPKPLLVDRRNPSFEAEQLYYLEIWVEKTTMNDVLEPLCSRYQVNLTCIARRRTWITGADELSITAALDFVKRVAPLTLPARASEAGRPARIFYVADGSTELAEVFDPAGRGMPVSVPAPSTRCASIASPAPPSSPASCASSASRTPSVPAPLS
jgi:hypothetical protein